MGKQDPIGSSNGRMPADNLVVPFQSEGAPVRGRLIRLGGVVDTILNRHDYPDTVSVLLGEACALTAMLGTALKIDGKFILQTKGDGPVDMLVVDFEAPGEIRGYAHYAADRLHAAEAEGASLLGQGHLAMTIDQGGDMDRYQGVVPLEGDSLSDAADHYFAQSEQVPTYIRLAVAKHYAPGPDGRSEGPRWRAGGLMIQHLPGEGGRGSGTTVLGEDNEDWRRLQLLAETVEDHELLDPLLEPERLLYRLFHEDGVRAFTPAPIQVHCRCTRERIEDMLGRFSPEDRSDMAVDGKITVTCEFCNIDYDFLLAELQ